jgi:hypothetical protein
VVSLHSCGKLFIGLLDIGYWILDIGYWILDIGYWILDIGWGGRTDVLFQE